MGGFAQNLIEGFAGAAGDQNTVNRIEKEKANKQALSHAELQTQTQSILDDVGGLQKRRAALDPKSPTYAQDIGDIDANLHKARQALTDLYHPANNPGALRHLGGFIKQHLGKQRGVPTTPAQAKESINSTIAGLDAAAAMPVAQASPQATAPSAAATSENNPYALKVRNLEAIGVPHDEAVRIATGQKKATPAGESRPIKQTADERARADFAEFKKDHPKYQGSFERWRKEQSTLPKAAGPAKPQRLSAAQNKAQSAYLEAVKLSDLADLVEKTPDDATNVKGFAIALERARAGRFTTQALDRMLEAGWGNRLQQWANNPTTGTLPRDILRQLVLGAHQNRIASKSAMDEAMRLDATIPMNRGGGPTAQPSGKAVSLAKAKQLPAMKGKTDDQIRQAIEASGHQVIP